VSRGLWILCSGVVVAVAVLGAFWAHTYPYAFGRHGQERQWIWAAARRERMDPWLVTAVVEVESHFRSDAVSGRGAVGLMQILPATGHWVETEAHLSGPLTDPKVNIAVGTWYLAYLSRLFHGRLTLILAAYNGGPETVEEWEREGRFDDDRNDKEMVAQIPFPETRHFVRRVIWSYDLYRALNAFPVLHVLSFFGSTAIVENPTPGRP